MGEIGNSHGTAGAAGVVERRNRRRELGLVLLLLAAVLVANLVTASRSPTVWIDEVFYSEPAVNLYLSGHFASAAQVVQPADSFWAANTPLHQVVLFGWLKVFGFGLVSVRAFDYVLASLAVFLLSLAVRREGFVPQVRDRLWMALLCLGGYSVAFAYRGARPDVVGIAVFAGAAASFSARGRVARRLLLFALGALVPLAGLQLLPFFGILALTVLWFRRRAALADVVSFFAGLLTGGLGLLLVYQHEGVLGYFIKLFRFTAVGTASKSRISGLATSFVQDPSYIVAMLAAAGLACLSAARETGARRPLVLGLILGAAIPVALHLTGVYPLYYCWMGFMPLAILLCVGRARMRKAGLLPRWSSVALFAIVGVGLPLRLAVTVLQWSQRSYAPVEQLVRANVSGQDVALVSPAAYYAVRTVARRTLYDGFKTSRDGADAILTPEERRSITRLVVSPARYDDLTGILGSAWRKVSSTEPAPTQWRWLPGQRLHSLAASYDLAVYARTPGERKDAGPTP